MAMNAAQAEETPAAFIRSRRSDQVHKPHTVECLRILTRGLAGGALLARISLAMVIRC